jgi:hypothetical protein
MLKETKGHFNKQGAILGSRREKWGVVNESVLHR